MPWTIWPALIVLWGVCWMFYPSPGRAPGAGELETQSHLHQPQPEELGGEFPFLASGEADLIFPFLEDFSFSDEWWAPHQLNTICDPLSMTMDHDTGAYPPDSAREFSPMTTVDLTRSPTNSLHPGSGSQLTLSPGVQQRSQSQGSEPVAVGITENIATTASGYVNMTLT
ncbi:C2H2-type domain-containing protein [Fusarium keratoplasticum]|uniref:C2H2-type domain-containing protein n=1 Tax=Fusarium keratoplasticum TaxID=1328300 RepID=A0ACC0R9L0_9HYPO|nr:C2H2-type domain-containing protein [Fusarium keratoplasticum]KAI8679318.1 C2H2-type domain-containing protein [Fusarium keratoplasticum]